MPKKTDKTAADTQGLEPLLKAYALKQLQRTAGESSKPAKAAKPRPSKSGAKPKKR